MDSSVAQDHLPEDVQLVSPPQGSTQPAVAPAWRKAVSATALAAAHLLPLTLFATGTQKRDWILAAALYLPMVFAVGAGLHRYFAHHAFKTSRTFQFLMGLLACCFFGDPIGFAGKHRIHHRFSDTERDVHAPRQGFWQCFYGSLVDDGLTEADLLKAAPDLARVPELRLLHRYFYVPGLLLMGGIAAWGGYTMLVAGYLLPWVLVALTGPSMVNFLCHQGTPRNFATSDRSSNNRFVAW
jgi:stearoyl-CoA desaturase (delta-9 desaturase)